MTTERYRRTNMVDLMKNRFEPGYLSSKPSGADVQGFGDYFTLHVMTGSIIDAAKRPTDLPAAIADLADKNNRTIATAYRKHGYLPADDVTLAEDANAIGRRYAPDDIAGIVELADGQISACVHLVVGCTFDPQAQKPSYVLKSLNLPSIVANSTDAAHRLQPDQPLEDNLDILFGLHRGSCKEDIIGRFLQKGSTRRNAERLIHRLMNGEDIQDGERHARIVSLSEAMANDAALFTGFYKRGNEYLIGADTARVVFDEDVIVDGLKSYSAVLPGRYFSKLSCQAFDQLPAIKPQFVTNYVTLTAFPLYLEAAWGLLGPQIELVVLPMGDSTTGDIRHDYLEKNPRNHYYDGKVVIWVLARNVIG